MHEIMRYRMPGGNKSFNDLKMRGGEHIIKEYARISQAWNFESIKVFHKQCQVFLSSVRVYHEEITPGTVEPCHDSES